MDFGVEIFPTDYSATPIEIAQMLEQRGFESVWFPEHTHIPASRETPYPVGGDLPQEYSHILDPLIALSAAAAATERIRLGTGLCLLIERDPIITAKEVASLDLVSDGRVLFGVGAGWNIEEMRNHGTDPDTRFGLLRERLEACKAIWTQEEASYAGKHVTFDRIWSWPKPLQQPHPPVLLGGNGRTAPDRTVAYADEWMPNAIGDFDKLRARITKLLGRSDEAGRPLAVTLNAAPRDAAELEKFAAAGVGRAVFIEPPLERARLEPRLDRLAQLAETVAG